MSVHSKSIPSVTNTNLKWTGEEQRLVESIKSQQQQALQRKNMREQARTNFRFMVGPDRLPNETSNYKLSPAARHAERDGSLDANMRATFNQTFNRKLKMRDTFTKIFPSYTHATPTTFAMNETMTHEKFVYPRRNDDGRITYVIDREYTHKVDQMKDYNETMYKMTDLVACFKPSGKK